MGRRPTGSQAVSCEFFVFNHGVNVIQFHGPGIGGYCLPKDGGLGYRAYKHIFGFEHGD